jgi:membrane protein DedA with SNARE-associated domain
VEDFLIQLFDNSTGLVAYLSVFGILLACGLGVPMPEDISLILGGYLAHRGAASLPVMMLVGFSGILAGDSAIFFIGRRLGSRVQQGRGFFARIITPEKRARVEGLFAAHGQKIVMLARFLPGVRAVTYFTAGSAGMSYLRFIAFDGLAALASAPLFIFLGYKFGGELELLVKKVRDGQIAVIVALVGGILAYVVFRRVRAAQQKRAQPAPAPAAEVAATTPAGIPDASGEEARRTDRTAFDSRSPRSLLQ